MDPLGMAQNVYALAKQIYAQAQLVEANKSQCGRLVERIKVVESSIRHLEIPGQKAAYQEGLKDLLEVLKECLDFARKLSSKDSRLKILKDFVKAGSYSERFNELNEALQKSIRQLNLGLATQQICNREQDKEDQRQDIQELQSSQQKIIDLLESGNADSEQGFGMLMLGQEESRDILLKKIDSVTAVLASLNRPSEKPPLDSCYMVPFFELEFGEKIGEGSFGRIYYGEWLGQSVVIKSIEGAFGPAEREEFIREVQIISRCRDRNVTQFYGASFEAGGRACIVMEPMEKGSLYQILEGPLSPELQRSIALDIAHGLRYLHAHGIFHRDLKSANILVNAYGQAKLSDFGLAKTRATSIKTIQPKQRSTAWLAPEYFDPDAQYTAASDVYSYGVILWELATGHRPYPGLKEKEIERRTRLQGRGESLEGISEPYLSLIHGCWEKDPAKRPDLKDIIHTLQKYKIRAASPTPEQYYQKGIQAEAANDYAHAFDAYKKAFDKGHVKAGTEIGLFFLSGKACASDKEQAYKFSLEAAQRGHVRAMVNVGMMLKRGDGVLQDLNEALVWFKKAAAQGDVKAAAEAQQLEALLQPSGYALRTKV